MLTSDSILKTGNGYIAADLRTCVIRPGGAAPTSKKVDFLGFVETAKTKESEP
jgi:hypothetical protein